MTPEACTTERYTVTVRLVNPTDYDIAFAGGAYTVDDTRGGAVDEGIDTVMQVETFTFADGSWMADLAGNLTPVPLPAPIDDMGMI